MKRSLFLIPLLLIISFVESQVRTNNVDSLKRLLQNADSDTSRVLLNAELGFSYAFLQVDTGIRYAQKAISLARQIQFKKGEAAGMAAYGWPLWATGVYDKAVDVSLKSLNLYKELKDYQKIITLYSQLAVFYRDAEDYEQALKYALLSKKLYDSLGNPYGENGSLPILQLGAIYLFANQVDSAYKYISLSFEMEKAIGRKSGYVYNMMGYVEAKKKHYSQALEYYHTAIPVAFMQKNYFDLASTHFFLALLHQGTKRIDSSIWYAKEILTKPDLSHFRRATLVAMSVLAQDYKLTNQNDSALKYLEARIALNDSLFNKEKARALQSLTFNEELQQQELERSRTQYQNQVKLYSVFGLSAVLLLIGIILYRNNQLKQKANLLLQQQKEKLESTLTVLKSTQSQLIQSEKMASLGELTAGIAHEIQNPLNFVNNFSEVNKELISEMKSEINSGNLAEAKAIAEDIESNEEKIMLHGKRADSIVKGMLQHSRSSSGVKEPVDINALADEYLRLSYQGLRARDKSLNATINTNFDPAVGSIQIIPQDIGRVLLNLYNNAFYAVDEKSKQQQNGYAPTVSVSTRKINGKLEIIVKDNGNGIPPKVRDKIFQPFFTTKPTGQGTGLGLSLSYDIVKAHGGEIKLESREGEFTEFVVQLPA